MKAGDLVYWPKGYPRSRCGLWEIVYVDDRVLTLRWIGGWRHEHCQKRAKVNIGACEPAGTNPLLTLAMAAS